MNYLSFLQKLTNLVAQTILELDHEKKPLKGFQPHRPLLPHESYLKNCLLSLGEVDGLIKQLNMAAFFLMNFRNTEVLKDNKISRYDHINYHIEGHLLRVTGVMDRLLVFVNEVLELKLSTFKCKSINLLHDNSLASSCRRAS